VTVHIDKTPPTIACEAYPKSISPVFGQWAFVRISVSLNDTLSGAAGFILTSATSTEVHPGTAPDKDILGFRVGEAATWGILEAERGNVYTFVYTGSDQAGNQSSCTVTIKVNSDDHHE
jgi:hypothetical protein